MRRSNSGLSEMFIAISMGQRDYILPRSAEVYSLSSNGARGFGDALPCGLDVAPLRIRLADGHAQRQTIVQLGVREIERAAVIEPVHQLLIHRVASAMPEAHQVERRGRSQLEISMSADPRSKLLRQGHVLADVVLQAFHAVMADYKPQLKPAKPSPLRNVPVAGIKHLAGFAAFVPRLPGQNAQRSAQRGPVC